MKMATETSSKRYSSRAYAAAIGSTVSNITARMFSAMSVMIAQSTITPTRPPRRGANSS